MKKKDIIKLVKKLVKEDAYGSATLTTQGPPRTGTVVPTDEYPFTARPKRTGTGMYEDENEPKGHWSAGLAAREIADSFDFEEIEQLYKDGLIDSSNYNGAKWILQGWIDQHPTYLPQRDLTSPKRQKIRNIIINANKMKKINEKTFAGKAAVEKFKNPTTNPDISKIDPKTKDELIKDLMKGGSVTTENINTDDVQLLIAFRDNLDDMMEDSGYSQDYIIRIKTILKNVIDTNGGEESHFGLSPDEMMEGYMKSRKNTNLMEHMDKYRKRTRLMEGAWKDISPMFKADKTDEEIVQYYIQKGIAPEHVNKLPTLVTKLRNNWNNLQKMKTDIDILDQEAEGLKQSSQPAVSGMEGGMGMEEKQLASGLFNETK